MIPSLINNPPRTGPAPDLPKLGEDAVLPLLIPQPLPGVLGVRGLNRVGPQGLHRKPTLVPAEMVSKAKALENFELVADRAIPDYGSSGSEHDPSSVSLFAMVHEFIENEGTSAQQSRPSDNHGYIDTNKASSKVNGAVEMHQALQSLATCADSSEEALLRETIKILELFNVDAVHMCDNGKPATVMHGCLKRMVISHLQKRGYNAAICKSKWDHVCGIPAGDYEYIDILFDLGQSKHPKRLLVDIDFQSQFEIARPSVEFTETWKLLPSVFVGRAERLKQIVHIMSEATKQSLRLKGLHLPPWRKPGYMNAKWLSSYRRTSNISSGRPCKEGDDGHANALGFAVRGGGLDARYTNTLEMMYHDMGSSFLIEEDKEAVPSQRGGDQITVIGTDWQPPPVAPRVMAPKKRGNVTGLSFLLLQGPTSACKEMIVQAA